MKVANSYPTLLRGVSQQVPQDRAEGQHSEQVNMLADPVNGLTRRHGSEYRAHQVINLPLASYASAVADTANWRSLDWTTGGKDYVVLYRTAARVGPDWTQLPLFLVYNKTDNVFLTVRHGGQAGWGADAGITALQNNGVAAITAVGRWLFSCANGTPIAGSTVQTWASASNLDKTVIWVRGGAFSRTFSVTVTKTDNSRVTFSYTTPSSSYQTALSTADIAATDPEYTKKVNDRVNAYNSAVTAWIGTSTAAVQPAAIAESLRLAAVAAGLTATRIGSHVYFTGVKSIETDDGGNGELLRGVADEIISVDHVSAIHHVGKVVKVRSRNANEAYYLKAVAKDKAVTTGYTEVTWVEGAGVDQTITGGLYYATVVGSNFYVASSASILDGLVAIGGGGAPSAPTFEASTAGDLDSAPTPAFVGQQVSYLGTFQNRLLVGSGGTLAVSKTDDYLNFFRSTVLTLPASDPFEMLPTGSEDDVLQASVLYNQNLVIFGKQRQYVVSGQQPLTPTSANMAVMSSYENAADCPPLAAGGFIFYAKRGEAYSSLFQIQPGQTDNSPESFPASSQVDTYLQGQLTELVVATGSPSIVFARSNTARNSLYTFSYLDKQDGRKLDAWSRWDFNEVLGAVIGVSVVTDGLLVFTLRQHASTTQSYVVADFCPLSTKLSSKPYLDSHRPWATVLAGTTGLTTASGEQWAGAFDGTSTRIFTGALLPAVPALVASYPTEPGMTIGALQQAYVEPTNPYYRDANEKAILAGRLTVGRLILAYRKSTGFSWDLYYGDDLAGSVEFNGRVLGDPSNIIGREPVSDGQHSVPIGRETRTYRVVIKARRWYPFTLTAIEWVGQFFNRVFRGK